MTEQAKRSASEGQSFFGLTPERLQTIVDEAERRFEQARIAYGDALVALGNAHSIHASPAIEAQRAFEKALIIYSLLATDEELIADVHHRLASVLRRLGERGQAAEHLENALTIWKQKETVEEQFLEHWRKELEELRTINRNSQDRNRPPS